MTTRNFIYGKRSLLEIQKELVSSGEFSNSTSTKTYSENKLAQLLIESKVKVSTGFRINDYEFDIKIYHYPILIEVDGGVHNDAERRLKDYSKDRMATTLGYKVYRFDNSEVCNNTDEVLCTIKKAIVECTRQPCKTFIYPLTPIEYLKFALQQKKYHPDLNKYYMINKDEYSRFQSWRDKQAK